VAIEKAGEVVWKEQRTNSIKLELGGSETDGRGEKAQARSH